MTQHWKRWHSLGLLLLLLVIAASGVLVPLEKTIVAWGINIMALALFGMVAGDGLTGNFWLGWLINEQNRMSLSRLQMALWTVVVLSAFLTAALVNIKAGYAGQALSITIPQELWLVMGISTTSLVASPLILAKKKERPASVALINQPEGIVPPGMGGTDSVAEGVEESTRPHPALAAANVLVEGQLVANISPRQAGIYDLVSGEEVGNFNILDLTRLQNLLFTLIIVGAYAASLGAMLKTAQAPITQFPEIGAGSLALLAISHAGYLTGKAIDKEPKRP